MKKAGGNGYYDIDVDIEDTLIGNTALAEMLAYKDIQNRKLFLNGLVNDISVGEIVRNILQYNKDDADAGIKKEDRKPIFLYITSNGGDVYAGYELIDAIEYSITPVYTINLGFQFSMAFMIGLAGHKRFASKNAVFLMHDGMNAIVNSGAKAKDTMMFRVLADERDKKYVVEHSNITVEEYDAMFRAEWYMFADQAKEKGCVDYIIGVDCTVDDIV